MDVSATKVSDKKRLVALLLYLFLGWPFAAHRFYAGKYGTAVLFIITFAGIGIWGLVDLVYILIGKFTDKQGRVMEIWT